MGRKRLVHGCRIAILICIVVLVRLQHTKSIDSRSAASVVELQSLAEVFPGAASVRGASDGRTEVLDADGTSIGYALQTSPQADHIIGFSGPTNVLIALSADDRVIGLRALSSGDTRDHVRQVVEDEQFMTSLNGLASTELRNVDIDAVSGATLTSLSISESIALRLGSKTTGSLRFPDPPSLDAVKRIFEAANQLTEESIDGSYFRVADREGVIIGSVLRTSPAADTTIGYQGPTETLVGFDTAGRTVGIAVGSSFDNEPYVGYVRDDSYFRSRFDDLDLDGLAEFDLAEQQIEGVSGATMTSMAVAEGVIVAASQRKRSEQQAAEKTKVSLGRWSVHDVGTVLCVIVGLLISLTRLRSNRKLAVLWQLILVGYLGLVAGSLLSMAMFVGWASYGISLRNGLGFVVLAVAALILPIGTRRNVYCTHLCPHGAVQQLLKNRLPWRVRLSSQWRTFLRLLPGLLLLWCVVVAMSGLAYSLVDIEPFDAWVFKVAGWATTAVAVLGLVASMFIPMAYCRYGCPTGALLEFLRFNSKSDHWSIRDWGATCLLVLAVVLLFANS